MDSAFRVYSPNQGYCKEEVVATNIKSSSHARKLAPFVDDNNQLVYWVRWSKQKASGKRTRAHFRSYPKHSTHSLKKQLHDEISSRQSESNESSKHKAAKLAVQAALQALIDSGKHLPWSISDSEISDFPMTGDLLANAVSIEVEVRVFGLSGKFKSFFSPFTYLIYNNVKMTQSGVILMGFFIVLSKCRFAGEIMFPKVVSKSDSDIQLKTDDKVIYLFYQDYKATTRASFEREIRRFMY